MLSFEDGFKRIRDLAEPLEYETISLEEAQGRVMRKDLMAARPHPAADISAMDGYALSGKAERYKLVGEIPAGVAPELTLYNNEAARIFTGALIPDGADRVLIQENAIVDGDFVIAEAMPERGAQIRKAGSDFSAGFTFHAPKRLSARDIALIGAMNFGKICATRKPQVSILATGSELICPGDATKAHQTIASNAYGLKAIAEELGADAKILPIAKDDLDEIQKALNEAQGDLIVTTGGASVGKYDYTKDAAEAACFKVDIHKIALRPGKPIMAGQREGSLFLGLPGNPISAMICAQIFMVAMIERLLGLPVEMPRRLLAKANCEMVKNGDRTHFMRAVIELEKTGFFAKALSNQDSAAISQLSRSNGLIVRDPFAPAIETGDFVEFIWINPPV